jgi:hypothetical protein
MANQIRWGDAGLLVWLYKRHYRRQMSARSGDKAVIDSVLRAIVFSGLLVSALIGTRYIAKNRFGYVILRRMIAWLSLVIIGIAFLDGTIFLSTMRSAVYFAAMWAIFSSALLIQAARRGRKD